MLRPLIVVTFLFLGAFPLLAQDRSFTIREIRDLSLQIEQATYATRSDSPSLEEAVVYMKRALRKIQSRPGTGQVFTLCRDYAFPILDRTLPTADAMDEAVRMCRTVEAFPEMKFLFEKYNRTLPTQEAMERAARFADINLMNKLDVLSFAYEKYNRMLPSSNSCDRAALGVATIQNTRGTLNCFKNTFPNYDRTLSSADAMDKTIQACR
ncbi:MAG: hypothetical protein K9K67_06930 [Bacteriovoracaceae bacterium]|nr:hypothetical protein [Bacteriovoracaceae bacterium]